MFSIAFAGNLVLALRCEGAKPLKIFMFSSFILRRISSVVVVSRCTLSKAQKSTRLTPNKMEISAAKRPRRSQSTKALKIAIEGNIATGKSTFLRLLEEKSKEWTVVPEPVARWTNIKGDDEAGELTMSQKSGGNLLQMFYDDIARWSYTFQSYALLSRMRLQRKPIPEYLQDCENPVQFFERSLQSDRYIFAKNCFESGVMSETEWNIYQDWSTYLIRTLGELSLDGIVYLRAEPEVCYDRMLKRGRPEESGVSLEYLKCLNEKHEAWLYRNEVDVDETLKGVPVLIIDCNEEFLDSEEKQRDMMARVEKFVLKRNPELDDSGLDSNSSLEECSSSDIEY